MRRKKPVKSSLYKIVMILGAIVLALAAAGVIVWVLVVLRPERETTTDPKAVVWTLLPAPSLTPRAAIAPQVTPIPSVTPAGALGVGVYMRVSGTKGLGLNFRAEPNTKSPILFLGMEAEVFQVIDGPRQADGFTWWYLQAPYDKNRKGWAANDFLTPIQNP
jgi:hypothetical protein